jgi:rod shape-determining protein MreD
MRILFPAALALAFVLEPTVGARFTFFGGHPLFVLGLVVYFALVKGAPAGVLFGWAMGFLCDLASISHMGLKSLSFSVVGFSVGNTLDSVYKDNAWTQAVILFAAVLLHEAIVYFVTTRLDLGAFLPYTLRYAVPTALVTAAAFPLLLSGFERLTWREISFDAHRVVVRRRR